MKHTPEPWELKIGPRYLRIVHPDASYASGARHIVKLDDANDPEVKANARLIAAAPDLLAACKGIAAALHSSMFNDDDGECVMWLAEFDKAARDALLDAITKAEGTTSQEPKP